MKIEINIVEGLETITVTDNADVALTINEDHRYYDEARRAAVSDDFDTFYELACDAEDEEEIPANMIMGIGMATSIPDMMRQLNEMMGSEGPSIPDAINIMKGMVADGIVSPEDLGIEEAPDVGKHDLSNWNGSPIFYDNEEEARDQARKSMGFWEFHDFGLDGDLPTKYRYATVPTSFGPTAPTGYDWVCLKRS